MSESETRDLLAPSSSGGTLTLKELTAKRRLVSVVGIDNYAEWPRLKNAVGDASGVHKLLVEKFGFTSPIEPLINTTATKRAIESLVEDKLRETLQDDDSLVIFFAGHGHTRVDQIGTTREESGYLVPVDARYGEHFSDLINIDDFLRAVGRLRALHILVVLDACGSGMALGSSVVQYRSLDSFVYDLARQRSRRVITSARLRQPALDTGPLPGHSLFTGTLVDCLTWGKADTDGNGIISSSELGLYLQQQVGQASDSRQTPDFGSFHMDARGELLISLGEDSFENVKARAYSALQSCALKRFEELVHRSSQLRPDSPETVYLRYRLALLSGEIPTALKCLIRLGDMSVLDGVLPLSRGKIRDLSIIIKFWLSVFSIDEKGVPVQLRVLKGMGTPPDLELQETALVPLGDLEVFSFEEGTAFALEVTNPTMTNQHVHCVHISPTGNINFGRLWEDPLIEYSGIASGETVSSYPFKVRGELGLELLWVFVSQHPLDLMANPPATNTRALFQPLSDDDARDISLKKLYLLMHAKARDS